MKRPSVVAQLNYERAREEMVSRAELREKFRYIHATNLWGAEDTASGFGSRQDATRAARAGLEVVCREYGVRSLLDVPCGDATWIHRADLPIAKYVGGDIVPEIIEKNQTRSEFQNARYSAKFVVLDITRDPLPRSDLVLCRDCLVHLSNGNIRAAMKNIVDSGSKYLLATTFPLHEVNEDIEDGDWRLLNMKRAPFLFPAPLAIFNEECDEAEGAYRDKSLAFWEIGQIARESELLRSLD